MMADVRRPVSTGFWTDGKVDDFSPEDKYFMLYLLTSPFSKQLGIYEISIRQAAFQMGYSTDAFNVLLDRFENKYNLILFSKETNEIAILNFLRHSLVSGGKPVEDCIKQDMARVKDKKLIHKVFSHVRRRSDWDDLNATVRKIVSEYLDENENNNDNDNDNDNDSTQGVSWDESCYDSPEPTPEPPKPPKKPKKKQEPKHKHGEHQKVLLTDSEFERLAADYGESLRDEAIIFLDAYIAEKGYKSQSHNLAIRRWVMDAVKERMARKDTGRMNTNVPDSRPDERTGKYGNYL
jgi:hypothetical protein